MIIEKKELYLYRVYRDVDAYGYTNIYQKNKYLRDGICQVLNSDVFSIGNLMSRKSILRRYIRSLSVTDTKMFI